MEQQHFIYITTNLVNGKYYIGKKTTPRKDLHPEYLGSGNNILAAVAKYGVENFSREIICFTTSKQANAKLEGEIVTIETVKDPLSYNLVPGGQGGATTTGIPLSVEHKAKISAANKGKTLSPVTKAKISSAQKGVPKSPKTCAKISAAKMGNTARTGTNHSLKTKALMSAAHKGIKKAPWTLERRERTIATRLANKLAKLEAQNK